jgi:hypothetical protein
MNRELLHEKDTRSKLEVLESDLLHRLQVKEKECALDQAQGKGVGGEDAGAEGGHREGAEGH